MKSILATLLLVLLTASISYGQANSTAPAASPAGQPATQASAADPDAAIRGAFPVTLMKSLDSKKLKEGDTVVCQTVAALHSRNGMMIPSGSKVFGHITKAQARSKGDAESSLAMVFDRIEVAKGKEVPMKGILQALAPSLGSSGPDTGVAGPGTLPNGATGNVTTMAPPSPGAVSGPNSGVHPLQTGSHPLLTSQSQGVLGFKNLQMDKDSVLTTSGKEVKLDSRTQMLIHAEIEVPLQ